MKSSSLNHVFRLVWNAITETWMAVPETARGRGKAGAALAAVLLAAGAAQAGPSGGVVTAGSGHITQTTNSTVINQQSQNLQLQWQSFNVGAGQSVTFVQPNAQALAVNQILDTNGSRVLGSINANGQVWLINPNGVYFGNGAQVNVGGLLASTLNPLGSTGTSAGGTQRFGKAEGSVTGSVLNEGTLTAAEGGYIALLGEQVRNQGVVSARLGTVALGAGSAVNLNFSGNQLLGLQIEQSTLDNLASNQQLIQASGGQVLMSAGAKDSLLASAVNNSGTIEARTVQQKDGRIILLAGMAAGTTTVGGTLDASAPQGGNGGFIETSGALVKVASDAKVTTGAAQGQSGTWLLDPTDFNIEAGTGASTSSSIGADTLSASLASGNVTIQTDNANGTGNGDIHINAPVSWATDNTLTLSAYRDININANLTATGAAGKLALEYGQGAVAANNPASYNIRLTEAGFGAKVNLKAGRNFSTKLGSNGAVGLFTVITDLGAETVATNDGTLQGLSRFRFGRGSILIALGADIDASVTSSWNAGQGHAPFLFAGTFDGLGHTITGLTINRPTQDRVGLFSETSSASRSIQNLGLVGGSVTGRSYVGALVGYASDSVFNVYSSAAVTGQSYVGGLIGAMATSREVRHVYATGNVTGVGGAGATGVGGLIGWLGRSGPPDSPNLSSSYATGNVSATDTTGVGGLVGTSNWAFISDSYATGNVTVTGAASAKVGGLVGDLDGLVSGSYAVGRVTSRDAATDVGGLVGAYVNTVTPASSITVTDNFWDTQTSGLTTSAVGTGKSTAEMKTVATFTGWNVTGNGGEYPKLVAGLNGTKPYGLAPGDVWQTPQVTPVAFTLSDISSGYTYSGGAVSLDSLWGAASIFGNTYSNWVLGTDYSFSFNGNTATSFTNAGTYAGIGVNVLKTGFLTAPSGNTTGSLTIARKAVTVSGITAADKTYDGSTSATVNTAGAVYTGLVAGEALSTTATGSFASKNASATAQVVSLAATTIAGANTLLSNYTVTEQASTTAKINQKAVTVSGITVDAKTYDGGTAATVNTTGAMYTGLVAGEALRTTATGAFADKNASDAPKTVALTASTTAGNANTLLSNYSVTEQTSATGTLGRKNLTITATATDKVYDGTATASVTLSSIDLVAGDTLAYNKTGANFVNAQNVADKNVGTNKTVRVDGLSLSGADSGNYSLVGNSLTSPTTARITPATLWYVAAPASLFVGQPLALSGSITGFVGGDTAADALTGTPSWTVLGNPNLPGALSVQGGGLSANTGNYRFAQAAGNANVLELKVASPSQDVQDISSALQHGGRRLRHEVDPAYVPLLTLRNLPGGGLLRLENQGVRIPSSLLLPVSASQDDSNPVVLRAQ